jgi:hypothetical protein
MAKKKSRKSSRRRRRNPATAAYPTGGGATAAAYPTGGGVRAVPKKPRKPRKSPKRARRYVASRGRGQHARARTYPYRSKHGKMLGHIRGWRARRANGTSGIVSAAIAVGVGLLTSVAAGYLINAGSSSITALQSSTTQDVILLGLAAAAGYFVPNPAVAAGMATGLLLVPLAKQVYASVPQLTGFSNVATLNALHRPALGSLHRPMLGSLHSRMSGLSDDLASAGIGIGGGSSLYGV